jgi:hypothetical protein
MIAEAAFRSHASQNRHSHVDIIIYDHLAVVAASTPVSCGNKAVIAVS